ncbi:VWA domain-containing protein [Nostoc sp. 2RC]|uniref:vWA domain-containing protein n=1 Tax=Nostoc sp. 2RC TaxID=2485484 RepID=UPI00162778AA|nr:vWA domain-containing protein [Nostoc sp. 2RC]MBC1239862.1 VWA domain-containing protein [Nostoc sp. 2RC]
MQNLFRQLRANKPLLFGIYGAIGCLIAAILLGEPLLALTKLAPSSQQTPQAIVLLIDTSSSMSDGKLTEVKTAATKFVERRNLTQDKLAVVSFGLEIKTATPLTDNANTLKSAIASLSEDGGTPMAQGLDAAVAELQATSLRRNILLFTDGLPDTQTLTSFAAESARSQRINLIAVATGDADTNYLAQLTGDPSLVFYANSGQFDQAFRNAEAAIYKQLVESEATGDYGVIYSALRIGGWTAFLAMGIALALIMGQNHYMHRRLLTFSKGSVSTIGSLAAGMVAGATGQLLFLPLTSGIPNIALIQSVLNWSVFGALVTGFLSLFIRRLKKLQLSGVLLTGAISGALAAGAWLMSAAYLGDVLARFIAAIVFGICIRLLSGSTLLSLVALIAIATFGQLVFLSIPGFSILETIGRIIGWAILGLLVGGGTRFFVPNLKLNKALLGGTIGGTLGAIGFLIAAGVFGDIPGRLSGAAILGFFIGLMIAWVEQEQLNQEPYLLVHWTPTEKTSLLLGAKPVVIGSSVDAQIPLNASEGFTPITAKIYQEGANIVMQFDNKYAASKNMKKTIQELNVGDTRKLGNITIEVKASTNQQILEKNQ